jgi:hypothetical protein
MTDSMINFQPVRFAPEAPAYGLSGWQGLSIISGAGGLLATPISFPIAAWSLPSACRNRAMSLHQVVREITQPCDHRDLGWDWLVLALSNLRDAEVDFMALEPSHIAQNRIYIIASCRSWNYQK